MENGRRDDECRMKNVASLEKRPGTIILHSTFFIPAVFFSSLPTPPAMRQ